MLFLQREGRLATRERRGGKRRKGPSRFDRRRKPPKNNQKIQKEREMVGRLRDLSCRRKTQELGEGKQGRGGRKRNFISRYEGSFSEGGKRKGVLFSWGRKKEGIRKKRTTTPFEKRRLRAQKCVAPAERAKKKGSRPVQSLRIYGGKKKR